MIRNKINLLNFDKRIRSHSTLSSTLYLYIPGQKYSRLKFIYDNITNIGGFEKGLHSETVKDLWKFFFFVLNLNYTVH